MKLLGLALFFVVIELFVNAPAIIEYFCKPKEDEKYKDLKLHE